MIMGMLTMVASLTMCLAIANAFVVRAGKVTPVDSAWKRQEPASSPLGVDSREPRAGRTILRTSNNDAAEARKKGQLRVPSTRGYAAYSWSTSVGKVAPVDSAWKRQEPASSPLGVDSREPGAGRILLRTGNNDAAEARKKSQLRVPSTRGYAAYSWSTSALHVFKGLEPEIIEDGNTTVPTVGGVGGEDGESSGVASVSQAETDVENRITVNLEELVSPEHSFGEAESVSNCFPSTHEPTSTTQKKEEDSTHGVSDDTDATTNSNLITEAVIAGDADITTDADIATNPDIANDVDLATDDELEPLNQEQLPPEESSDAINDESHGMMGDHTGLAKELSFDMTADGVASVVSIVLESAFDGAMGPLSHDIEGGEFYEQPSFDLGDNPLVDEMTIRPFSSEMPDRAANDVVGFVAHDEISDGVDEISDGPVSKAVRFGGDMDDLVWSILQDALTRGLLGSEDLILDNFMDHVMWSKLRDAISGRAAAELTHAFDDMMTSLLHQAFFGPAASKAVFSLAKTTDDGQLVVDEYVLAVTELYGQLKEARYRRTADRATADGVVGEVSPTVGDAVDDAAGSVSHDIDDSIFDEKLPIGRTAGDRIEGTAIWPFDPGMKEHATADEFTPVLYNNGDRAFYDDLRSALDAYGLVDETVSTWPSDPGMAGRAAADGSTSALYDDIFDGAGSEEVDLGNAVNNLVLSVVRNALARGTEMSSADPIIDAAIDNLMWSKLHDAISGQAAPKSENLADALDEVVTCLLHDAFFGPEASEAVSAMAEIAGDSQLVVDDYVRAVTELYGNFKEARDPNLDSKSGVVQKAGKGLGSWVKKIWRKVRRKER